MPGEGDVLWNINAGDTPVGTVRRISLDAPAWAAAAYGFEVDLQALGASVIASRDAQPEVVSDERSKKSFKPIPSMPAMEVDLALIVPDSHRAADVERVIRASAGDLARTGRTLRRIPRRRYSRWREEPCLGVDVQAS
jgi:hypothetical protein